MILVLFRLCLYYYVIIPQIIYLNRFSLWNRGTFPLLLLGFIKPNMATLTIMGDMVGSNLGQFKNKKNTNFWAL